ncbi:8612_t:CDS:1 [Funneliformis geosporum]|uniref:19756_t:CDS:1 n=1 Tax=Funneliformis geosporum TaxID=1117311 RepID=A0A9W4SCN2_9GLOM|nr:8612_t:CDS:1 [Funneliformis geosporum]CAI2163605.1 19756_t:CDS:1 [Funneliformis geosporum]
MYYYVTVHLLDFYITYVTTILLGLTNGLFYLITMRLIRKRWKVGKSNNNNVSNDHEQFIDMEHIDEIDDSIIVGGYIDDVEDSDGECDLIRISCENEDNDRNEDR